MKIYIIILLSLVVGFVIGFNNAKYKYTKPFYITIERISESKPKLSKLHLNYDSISRDTTYHKGQVFTPVIFYNSFLIDPSKYEK